jgi:hypothetical protein
MVGLFFFIRASVKPRIEELTLVSKLSPDNLTNTLGTYFQDRAYHIKTRNSQNSQIVFEGFVRPSWFLAILLTVLAALGLFSLIVVIYYLYPPTGLLSLVLVLLAPLAGIFYWKNAGRPEEVVLNINPLESDETQIEIIAHRDELLTLQKSIKSLIPE